MPFDKPRRQAEAEEDVAPTFHSELRGEGERKEKRGGRGGFTDCGLNRLMRLISTFHLPWTIIIRSGQHCAAICWIFWVDQSVSPFIRERAH